MGKTRRKSLDKLMGKEAMEFLIWLSRKEELKEEEEVQEAGATRRKGGKNNIRWIPRRPRGLQERLLASHFYTHSQGDQAVPGSWGTRP